MKRMLVLLVGEVLFAGLAFAHGDEQHIMGTVTKITDRSITVEVAPKQGHTQKSTVTVNVVSSTKFAKMDAAARRDATAPGSSGGHDHGTAPPPPPPNSSGIVVLPNSGGTGIFSGPTFFCTYRSVAFQGGLLFVLWNQLNGVQPPERVRAVFGVTYYFLRGRK